MASDLEADPYPTKTKEFNYCLVKYITNVQIRDESETTNIISIQTKLMPSDGPVFRFKV